MLDRANQADFRSDPTAIRAALEKAGWRYTRQRAAVYEFLSSVHFHPTAEEAYTAIRPRMPKISLATVYKALEALVASDLASKLSDSDGPARYDSHTEPHYHLRDIHTGDVRDLDTRYDAKLIEKLDPTLISRLQRQGYEVTGYRLELLCRII